MKPLISLFDALKTFKRSRVAVRGESGVDLPYSVGTRERVVSVDQRILHAQEFLIQLVDHSFTFNKALFLFLLAGAGLSFLGDQCQGSMSWRSPLSIFLLVNFGYALLFTALFVKLSLRRVYKMLGVLVSSLVLTRQGFYLYQSHMGQEVMCKPFVMMNDVVGASIVFVPFAAILVLLFFGNREV